MCIQVHSAGGVRVSGSEGGMCIQVHSAGGVRVSGGEGTHLSYCLSKSKVQRPWVHVYICKKKFCKTFKSS